MSKIPLYKTIGFSKIIGKFPYRAKGIYQLYCESNKHYYVGSSCKIGQRLSRHIRDLENKVHINKHLQNAWNKYGPSNFELTCLEKVETIDELIVAEKKHLDRLCAEGKLLFNVELNPTDKSGSKNAFYGMTHTDKTKLALSHSHRKITKTSLRAILTLINSGVVKSRDIAAKFGISDSTISEIKSKKRKYIDVEEYPCVIVTGSQGFISGYLVKYLIDNGYFVFGIDNYSKYGEVSRAHDDNENFWLIKQDLTQESIPLVKNARYIIAGAARIGGISYFSKYPRHIMRDNELILANTFDTALKLFKDGNLERIVVISSSMVYEGADAESKKLYWINEMNCCGPENGSCDPDKDVWPCSEDKVEEFPPPLSVYGFQKLAAEFWAKAYWEQDKLPYTIVRPFNAVGLGEEDAVGDEEVLSGNVKLMMSHVLPDLINKCLKGQDPLHILGTGEQVRCYTHGHDIARGIVMAMQSEAGENEAFNISSSRATTVLELAKMVWDRVNPDKPFRVAHDQPYLYDVQKRIPDTKKAKGLLGFEATIPLEYAVDELVKYMREKHEQTVLHSN